jgi:hypothetical protein
MQSQTWLQKERKTSQECKEKQKVKATSLVRGASNKLLLKPLKVFACSQVPAFGGTDPRENGLVGNVTYIAPAIERVSRLRLDGKTT